MSIKPPDTAPFIDWFRSSSPYIHAHRGCTFVIAFGGEAVANEDFPNLIHDIALLHGLGIRLVLVHGARPQIEARLSRRGAQMQYVNGLRITDDAALACVKEAAGAVRVEIEALLSMGLANSPMAGVRIRAASGNFVTARPLGILDGIDYCHTGKVRRVDAQAIQQRLDAGAIALIPPIGYSPTGEVFNLGATELASATAIALNADKLISLVEDEGLKDSQGQLISNIIPAEVERLLDQGVPISEELSQQLHAAIYACRSGVKRVHLISRQLDGALLLELFTRDGVGNLLTTAPFEDTRGATIDDVGGILELIGPLEAQGILVRRSRELLENEIHHFSVVERDGMVIACAGLYPYPSESMAELTCLAVHPAYRDTGRGDTLLQYMEQLALTQQIDKVFVLTTHTIHWFQERGFAAADIGSLPIERQHLYNYQRNSKTFIKHLADRAGD